jgi:hypothetical protein
MDYLGPLPVSTRGDRYILVFADHFSKWVEAIAVPAADAATTADALYRNIFCRFGTPTTLLSDRGTHFTADLVASLCRFLGIDRRTSTAYHPQTQGLVERFNGTLLNMLAKFTSSDQHDWDLHLPAVTWAYNTSEHASTGFSPYEILFGTAPVSLLDAALQPPRHAAASFAEHTQRLQQRLVQVHDLVQQHLASARNQHAAAYDRRHRDAGFEPGDLVYLHTPQPRAGASRKLQSLWTGPWTIVDRRGPLNYSIRLEGSDRTQLVPITRLKPAPTRAPHLVDDQRADDAVPTDATADTNDDPPDGYFDIDHLLDRRRQGRGFRYLVRWKGFDATADSWEPRHALPRTFVDAYDHEHPPG